MKKALLEENLLCTPLNKLFQKLFGTNGEKELEKPQNQQLEKSDRSSPNISKNPKHRKSTHQENRAKYDIEAEEGDDNWKSGLIKLVGGGNSRYHIKESEVANKIYERENLVTNLNEQDIIVYNSVTNAEGPESIGYFIYIPIPANLKNHSPHKNSPEQRFNDPKVSLVSSLENKIKPITTMLEPESNPKLKYKFVSSEPSPEPQYPYLLSSLESTYSRPTEISPMSGSKEVLSPVLKSLDPTTDSFYRLNNIEPNDKVKEPIKEEGNSEQSQPSSLVFFQESNTINKLKMIPQSKDNHDLESDSESGKSAIYFSDQGNNTKQINITKTPGMKEEALKPSVPPLDFKLEPNMTMIEIVSGQEKYGLKPEHNYTAVSTFRSSEPIEESDDTNYINAIPEKIHSQAFEPSVDTILGYPESSSIEPSKVNLRKSKEEGKSNPNPKFVESSLNFSTKSTNIKRKSPDHSENVIIERIKSSVDFLEGSSEQSQTSSLVFFQESNTIERNLKQPHESKPTDIKIAEDNKLSDADLNSSIITLDLFLKNYKSEDIRDIVELEQARKPKHSMALLEPPFEFPEDPINSKLIEIMPEYKGEQLLEPQCKLLGSFIDNLAPELESTQFSSANKSTPLTTITKTQKNEELENGLYQLESKFNSSLGSIKIEPLNTKIVLEPETELSENKFKSSQQSINSNSSDENTALQREFKLSVSKLGLPLESYSKSKVYKGTAGEHVDVLEPDFEQPESKLDQSLASKMAKSKIEKNEVIQNSELSGSKITSLLDKNKSIPPQAKVAEDIDVETRKSKLDSSLESIKSTLLEVRQGLGPELEQSISILKTSIDSFKSKSINSLQSIKSLKSIKSILEWTNRSNEKERNTGSKFDLSIQSINTKSLPGIEEQESNWKQSGENFDSPRSTLETIKTIPSKQNEGLKVALEYTRSKLDSSLESTDPLKGQEALQNNSDYSGSKFNSLLDSTITNPNKENGEIKNDSKLYESNMDFSQKSMGTNPLEGSEVLVRLYSKPEQSESNSLMKSIKFLPPKENENVTLDSEPTGSCLDSSLESIKANSLVEKEVSKHDSIQLRSVLKCSQESITTNPSKEREALNLESTGSKLNSPLESVINSSNENKAHQLDFAPLESKIAISLESIKTKSLEETKQALYSKQSGSNFDSSLESIRTNRSKHNVGLKLDSEKTRSKLYSSLLESIETKPSKDKEELDSLKLKQLHKEEVYGRDSDQGTKLSPPLESIKTKPIIEKEKLKIESELLESGIDSSLESTKTNNTEEIYSFKHDSKQSQLTLQSSLESIKTKEKEDLKSDSEPSIRKLDFSLDSMGTEPNVQTESTEYGLEPSHSKLEVTGESPTHTKD